MVSSSLVVVVDKAQAFLDLHPPDFNTSEFKLLFLTLFVSLDDS